MDQLIDNLARELAKPTSRRSVMRLIGGAMFGGVIAAWTPASLKAQTCSPPCAGSKPICCTTGSSPFCIAANQTCCGNTKCPSDKQCCTTSASPFCAPAGQTCCGTKSCSPNHTCCNNSTCCNEKQACISKRCQASNG